MKFSAPALLLLVLAASPSFAAEDIVFETGVEYTNPDNQHLRLNIARPAALDKVRPAVLCIHGGGFRAGKRERWDDLCKRLAARGYVAATVASTVGRDRCRRSTLAGRSAPR